MTTRQAAGMEPMAIYRLGAEPERSAAIVDAGEVRHAQVMAKLDLMEALLSRPPVRAPSRRQLGFFSVSLDVIENEPELALQILEGVVVVHADQLAGRDVGIRYAARHADFDEVPHGDMPPTYQCVITQHYDRGRTTYTRRWEKMA